jgi:hypothetical protein
MPRVQASISLPYLLKLKSGLYPTGRAGHDLAVQEPTFLAGLRATTAVSITSDQPDTEDPDEQGKLNARQADQLLGVTNRLLRCYRAMTRNATITELCRAEASPFRFRVLSAGVTPSAWESKLSYEANPPQVPLLPTLVITERVGALLAAGSEPEVADLFLLDAERALHEGRFREAVLFCWSTIDSKFNQKYDNLVNTKLVGEWSEAREFFKGVDFGLKNKMSAALFLVSGRSLFREPGELWQALSNSYNKRNGIIHRGEGAQEDDAHKALDVARRVVDVMATI